MRRLAQPARWVRQERRPDGTENQVRGEGPHRRYTPSRDTPRAGRAASRRPDGKSRRLFPIASTAWCDFITGSFAAGRDDDSTDHDAQLAPGMDPVWNTVSVAGGLSFPHWPRGFSSNQVGPSYPSWGWDRSPIVAGAIQRKEAVGLTRNVGCKNVAIFPVPPRLF